MNRKAKGPAEVATSPSRGSTISPKETSMNDMIDNTAPKITPAPSRRTFLAGLAAAGTAATLPAAANAEAGGKTSRLPQPIPDTEHPWIKARRLADELSSVLNEVDDGKWFAMIYPSKHTSFSVMFGDIRSHHRSRFEVSPTLIKLIEEETRALEETERAFTLSDSETEKRRWIKACEAHQAALHKVLAFVPANAPTMAHKASFLREITAGCVLGEREIDILLTSLCEGHPS
jgi:hypothetical protein